MRTQNVNHTTWVPCVRVCVSRFKSCGLHSVCAFIHPQRERATAHLLRKLYPSHTHTGHTHICVYHENYFLYIRTDICVYHENYFLYIRTDINVYTYHMYIHRTHLLLCSANSRLPVGCFPELRVLRVNEYAVRLPCSPAPQVLCVCTKRVKKSTQTLNHTHTHAT
jgi:hypothetical protein